MYNENVTYFSSLKNSVVTSEKNLKSVAWAKY